VDHGIESSPAKRRAAGKPETAKVQLRAFHRGGSIFIEVEDDGRGMDRQKILSRAHTMGLVGSDVTVDDHGLLDVIFEPGFSTADKVTEVSGRGVGMDVVKKNVEALRGRIEMMSSPGQGTLISIRLPLSIAVIDGMIIMAGRERYIIPTLSVVRSLRPRAEDLVSVARRGEMISVEGKLIPLFRLGHLFEISDAIQDPLQGIVVLVEDAGRQVALLADGLLGQQQIVIKGLGDYLHGAIGIAGGAIMPDGRVGLIIDVNGLVRLAHRVGSQEQEQTETSATDEVAVNQERVP
jgi:two-component system chemotaxis sensor kinase CheA